MNFESFIIRLDQWGVADVLLPFILVFGISYAILNKSEILGEKKKNLNIVVALVLGMSVVFPHVLGVYPAQTDPVNVINRALPNVSVVLIAAVMLLMLIGLFGGKPKWIEGAFGGWLATAALVIVVFIFGNASGWFGTRFSMIPFINNPDTQAMIIMLLVFGLIVYFVTSEDKDETKNSGDGVFKEIAKAFGGK